MTGVDRGSAPALFGHLAIRSIYLDRADERQGDLIEWSSSSVTPTIESHGWVLISGEERAAKSPDTFKIPPRGQRECLSPGTAAKLLFDIETRQDGRVLDRGVDRMWVIVKATTAEGYVGVLDNDPGLAENLHLREGDVIHFGPAHICEISAAPRDYIIEKYGTAFFDIWLANSSMIEAM